MQCVESTSTSESINFFFHILNFIFFLFFFGKFIVVYCTYHSALSFVHLSQCMALLHNLIFSASQKVILWQSLITWTMNVDVCWYYCVVCHHCICLMWLSGQEVWLFWFHTHSIVAIIIDQHWLSSCALYLRLWPVLDHILIGVLLSESLLLKNLQTTPRVKLHLES